MVSVGTVRAVKITMLLSLAGGGAPGCGSTGGGGGSVVPSGPQPFVDDSQNQRTAGGGDPFAKALTWPIVPQQSASLTAELLSIDQIDVYDVGPIYAGDHLRVEVDGWGSLDAVVAIFDADHNVIVANDDRSFYGGLVDPLADALVSRDSPHAYIAVSVSPRGSTGGGYSLKVKLTENTLWDGPAVQRVYLNFDGAPKVGIGTRTPVAIPAFDAGVIDESLSDNSQEIMEALVALVSEDYVGLDVELYPSYAGPPPVEPYSTVHFGSYDPNLLGVAENVDEYNLRAQQEAVVFVDTFAAFAVLNPSAQEIAQALANVASHEIGHLLGLYHTKDTHGVMDITASLRQMLGDQYFALSPLNAEVFPDGNQDAIGTLIANVGGDWAQARSAAKNALANRSTWYDKGQGRSARSRVTFGTCPACQRHRRAPADALAMVGG